jgi:hypothetical protein
VKVDSELSRESKTLFLISNDKNVDYTDMCEKMKGSIDEIKPSEVSTDDPVVDFERRARQQSISIQDMISKQQKIEIKQLFQMFDLNGDGQINKKAVFKNII